VDLKCPCDLYFGALDGNWDNDGDRIFGEGAKRDGGTGHKGEEADFYAEVYVGRATVDTSTEVSNFINKIIAYEQVSTEPYIKRGLMVGEKLDIITWGGNYKDEIVSIFPNDWEIKNLYQRSGTFSKSNVIKELNAGKNLVNHMGHADENHVMGLYRSDVDGLNNNDYFFTYSQGCYAGAFDEGTSGSSEAIAEHFILSEHGAFAVVMNSRYGWYSVGSTDGASQYFDREFFDAIFNENILNLGKTNQDSKEDNIGKVGASGAVRWCYFDINLLGDPETSVKKDCEDITPPERPSDINAELTGVNYENVTITWTLSKDDGNGHNDVIGYDVYRNTIYNSSKIGYNLLVTVPTGVNTYTDIYAGNENLNSYFYYVVAKDEASNTNSTIDQAGKFVKEMQIGRQLVSIPLVQSDTPLTAVLQTIGGSYSHVEWYEPLDTIDHWKSYSIYKPSGFNDLLDVDHKMALWITMTSPDNLAVAGKVPSSTSIQLHKGWNFVSYASFIDSTVGDALNGMPYEQVEGFDDTGTPYYLKILANTDIMKAGCGYWIRVTNDCMWTVKN
jgi:hypothetical protein